MGTKDDYKALKGVFLALDRDLKDCPTESIAEKVKVTLPDRGGVVWYMRLAEVKWLIDKGWVLEVSKV